MGLWYTTRRGPLDLLFCPRLARALLSPTVLCSTSSMSQLRLACNQYQSFGAAGGTPTAAVQANIIAFSAKPLTQLGALPYLKHMLIATAVLSKTVYLQSRARLGRCSQNRSPCQCPPSLQRSLLQTAN